MRRLLAIIILLCGASISLGQYQLASPSKLAAYRAVLPKTEDATLKAIFENPRTLWYNHGEMPRCYQNDVASGGGRMTVHTVHYDVSGGLDHQGHGHANNEWPWFNPQTSTNRDNRVKNFFGLLLPKGKPVVWYPNSVPSPLGTSTGANIRYGVAWIFPIGTQFVEVITTRIGRTDHTFKVLHMERRKDDWFRRVYRPFPTLASYEKATGREIHLVGRAKTLQPRHPQKTLRESRVEAVIAGAHPEETRKLLNETPFVECLETKFTEDIDYVTARTDGQIVPREYLGTFFGGRQDACRNCHRDVNSHSSAFEMGREWYGTIRGSDEVFSFHPFDHSCIADHGHTIPVRIHRGMERAGIVARYNNRVHIPPHYGPPRL